MPRHHRIATAINANPPDGGAAAPRAGRTDRTVGECNRVTGYGNDCPDGFGRARTALGGGRGPGQMWIGLRELLYGPVNRATARLPAVLTCLTGPGPDEDSLHKAAQSWPIRA
jgi:hypothetical protein